MIYLVTGVPGSGKSLLMVSWIEGWLKEGRAVYSNIDGIDMKGVGPLPEDWRDTPEGSVWIYDEVQQHWPSSGRPGSAERDDIRALETHRHTGHDIVIACQHPTLVHHHVRKLVGHHSHIERMMNNRATVFTWHQAQDVSDGAMRHKADKTLWKYPKRLFGYYKSATAHTHRFRMPRKLLALGAVVAVLVGGGVYAFTAADFLLGSGPIEEGIEQKPSKVPERTTTADRGGPRMVSAENVTRESEAAALIGGDPSSSLDGSKLTDKWRLVGSVEGADRAVFLIKSVNGDRLTVPSDGWEVVGYDDGLLTVKAPGGRLKIGWHTPVNGVAGRSAGMDSSDSASFASTSTRTLW